MISEPRRPTDALGATAGLGKPNVTNALVKIDFRLTTSSSLANLHAQQVQLRALESDAA
jgi:hypothetical protein